MPNFDRPVSHFELFKAAAAQLSSELNFADAGLSVDERLLEVAAKLYFVLNRAYKLWRVEHGHYTEPEKIAALSCAAVLLVRPIVATDQEESRGLYFSNPALGLQIGCGIIGANPKAVKTDTFKRLVGWMDQVRVQSSQRAIENLFTAIAADEFFKIEDVSVTLTPGEVVALDMLVATFELMVLSK